MRAARAQRCLQWGDAQPPHPNETTPSAHLQQLQGGVSVVLLGSLGQGGQHGGLALLQRRRLLLKQCLVRLERALLLGRQRQCLLHSPGRGGSRRSAQHSSAQRSSSRGWPAQLFDRLVARVARMV